MCGIAGVAGDRAIARVRAMLPLMSHRGPDGNGFWSSTTQQIALGHKRLAINDLSDAGTQPMLSKDGQLAVVVNGEIYNYPELRKELEYLGALFQSNSDSEVVIHAWRQWGYDCFIRFNGMFAICIYDTRQDLLVLARDRLGIKPLYYHKNTKELVFSSEVKSLLAGLNSNSVDIDPIALNQYLTYQNYFGDRSLRKGIKLLQAGHTLSYIPGRPIKLNAFWSLSFDEEDDSIDFSTALEEYRETLNASVHRHLLSDVPVASYLSAGFDSATIATKASVYGPPPVCFTGNFNDGDWYDEASLAAKIAMHNRSKHVIVDIGYSDLPRVLDKLIYALDEPRMGIGAFSQYCVAEQVAKTHKVILTGHGGDELFSGYPVFKLALLMSSLKKNPISAINLLFGMDVIEWTHLGYFALSALKSRPYKQFMPVINNSAILQKGLKPEWAQLIKNQVVENELIVMDGACHHQLHVLYSHYLQTYLNGLLVVEDKISMAHSLESRTPMLDNAMLTLSLKLPQQIKLHQGQLKAIIKKGGHDWLYKELYSQPKRGFPTPLRYWLRGNLRMWFIEKITGNSSGLRKLFRDDWLKSACFSYLNSSKKNIRALDEIQTHRMWQLLSLESWLRDLL